MEINIRRIHLCVMYLMGIRDFGSKRELGKYSIDNLTKYLKENYKYGEGKYTSGTVFNSDDIWNEYILKDSYLSQRVEQRKVNSMEELWTIAREWHDYKQYIPREKMRQKAEYETDSNDEVVENEAFYF